MLTISTKRKCQSPEAISPQQPHKIHKPLLTSSTNYATSHSTSAATTLQQRYYSLPRNEKGETSTLSPHSICTSKASTSRQPLKRSCIERVKLLVKLPSPISPSICNHAEQQPPPLTYFQLMDIARAFVLAPKDRTTLREFTTDIRLLNKVNSLRAFIERHLMRLDHSGGDHQLSDAFYDGLLDYYGVRMKPDHSYWYYDIDYVHLATYLIALFMTQHIQAADKEKK